MSSVLMRWSSWQNLKVYSKNSNASPTTVYEGKQGYRGAKIGTGGVDY